MRAVTLLPLLVACTHRQTLPEARKVTGDVVVVDRQGQAHETDAKGLRRLLADGEVTRVSERRRGVGAVEGLLLGCVVGGTVGALAGYAEGDDRLFSAARNASMMGVVVGLAGGGLGLVVGAMRGSTYIYENDTVTVSASAPTGSVGGVTVQW